MLAITSAATDIICTSPITAIATTTTSTATVTGIFSYYYYG